MAVVTWNPGQTTSQPTSKSSSSSGVVNWVPLTYTTPTQQPQNKIQQVQAPSEGFKIGDVVKNIEGGITQAAATVKKFTLNYLPQTVSTIQDIVKNPLSLGQKQDPKIVQTVKDMLTPNSIKNTGKLVNDIWNVIQPSVASEKQAWNDFTKSVSKGSPSEIIGKEAKVITGAANVAFSPVTTFFDTANKVPVIGTISKLFTLPFTAAGEGATTVSNALVDKLPISQQAKNNLKPGLGEIAALAAQIGLGKADEISAAKRGELIQKFGVQDAMTIETKAKELASKTDLKPGESKPQDIINHVISNKLEDTPQGHQMLKTALEAKKADSTVTVVNQADTLLPRNVTSEGGTGVPSELTAETKPSLTETVKTSPSNSYLPATKEVLGRKDFISKYNDTTSEKGNLEEMLKKVAGDRKVLVNVKDINTTAEKIASKLQKDPNYDISRVPDMLRSRVLAKDAVDKTTVLSELKKQANVVHVTDHTADTNPWGYQGLHAIIKTEKGNFNEVQIHTPEEVFIDKQIRPFYNKYRRQLQIPENIFDQSRKLANDARQEFDKDNSQKPSKIGKSIESKAVEAGLTKGFSETAGYTPIKIKEQAARATKLISENFDEARAIIKGEKELPDNLKGTALITAMEEHIRQNPSKDLAYELANSPLVIGTSEAAQELRLAAERTPDSATARLADIKRAREQAATAKSGKTIKQVTADTIKDIKKEITKTAPKKLDWAGFIKSIQC